MNLSFQEVHKDDWQQQEREENKKNTTISQAQFLSYCKGQ